MKTVFFHEDDVTIAYSLDELKASNDFQKDQGILMHLGVAKRHPKDPPNRKIGNSVAAGRMYYCHYTIVNISELVGGVSMLLKNDKVTISLFKNHENQNFYIKGILFAKDI